MKPLKVESVADAGGGGTKWVPGLVSLVVLSPGGGTPIAGNGAMVGKEIVGTSEVAEGGGSCELLLLTDWGLDCDAARSC